MHGIKVGEPMGLNTWAAFSGSDDLAAVVSYLRTLAPVRTPRVFTQVSRMSTAIARAC